MKYVPSTSTSSSPLRACSLNTLGFRVMRDQSLRTPPERSQYEKTAVTQYPSGGKAQEQHKHSHSTTESSNSERESQDCSRDPSLALSTPWLVGVPVPPSLCVLNLKTLLCSAHARAGHGSASSRLQLSLFELCSLSCLSSVPYRV